MTDAASRDRPCAIQPVVDELLAGRWRAGVRPPQDFLAELCRRLIAAGLPLHRVAVFVRTLHPNIMGMRFLWKPEAGVEVTEAPLRFPDHRYLPEEPAARGHPDRPGDPAPARRSRLSPGFRHPGRVGGGRRHRLPDRPARLHRRPGARGRLDHGPGGWLRGRRTSRRWRRIRAPLARLVETTRCVRRNGRRCLQHLRRPRRRPADPAGPYPARRPRAHPRRPLLVSDLRVHALQPTGCPASR